MTTLEIHPEYRALLEAGGLGTFDALFAAGGAARVDGHASRSVARLELRGAGAKTVIYLKRQWGAAARVSWKDLLRGQWPMLPARREWMNMQRLLAAGIGVSLPVAWGWSDGPGGLRSLLATRAIPGLSLARRIDEASAHTEVAGSPRPRRAAAAAVGKAVRRLHEAGFSFPDLYAKHIYLEQYEECDPRIVLIDVHRLRRFLPWRAAGDLAALYVSTGGTGVTLADRMRVLRAYLGSRRLHGEGGRLMRRVERLAERMAGRGKDPNLMASRRARPPGERSVEIDGGRLRVNPVLRPVLEAAGLATLDAIMAFRGGEVYREVPGRSTVRVELPDPAGGTRAFYIKRYTAAPAGVRLRRTFGLGRPESMAATEIRGMVRVTDAGIPTMRRAAVGEELACNGRSERSCLITEEIAGAVQADKYCEAAFGQDKSREAVAAKRRLIRDIASLARRFHGANLSHRDFYLCHILVRPVAGKEPVLHLIDYQRVTHHRRGLPERWRVKDLAALLFSSRPSAATHIRSPAFTRTDAMRFARAYFNVSRPGPEHKRLLRCVLAKARRIARHESHRGRRPEGGA